MTGYSPMSSIPYEIGLNVRIEKGLISPLQRLHVRARRRSAATIAAPGPLPRPPRRRALHGIKIVGLLHIDDSDVALDRPRFPNVRMCIGPARQFAGHLGRGVTEPSIPMGRTLRTTGRPATGANV